MNILATRANIVKEELKRQPPLKAILKMSINSIPKEVNFISIN